jgi:hypothetical protein
MFHLRFGLELLGNDRKLIMIALVLLDMRFGFDYCFIANWLGSIVYQVHYSVGSEGWAGYWSYFRNIKTPLAQQRTAINNAYS